MRKLFQERNLEPSRLNGLPLPQANAVWSMNWKEVKVSFLSFTFEVLDRISDLRFSDFGCV